MSRRRRDALHRGRRHALIALAIAGVVAAAAAAAGQPAEPGTRSGGKVTVALLPLDAEARLALYGQPVAAEISRALAAEGLDVAVVGQGDPVPTRAVLVVDGTLTKKSAGSGGAITIALRVRDPDRGEVLVEVKATAASLTAIDKAASEIAAKLIPEVRTQLATREAAAAAAASKGRGAGSGDGPGSGTVTARPAPAPPAILLVATSRIALDGRPDAMVAAIAPAFEELILDASHRPVASAIPVGTTHEAIGQAVTAAGARLGLTIEILGLEVELGKVPVGRARARVQIVDASGAVRFDRVIRTDTLVGRRGEVAAHIASYAGAQLAEVMRTRILKAARSGAP